MYGNTARLSEVVDSTAVHVPVNYTGYSAYLSTHASSKIIQIGTLICFRLTAVIYVRMNWEAELCVVLKCDSFVVICDWTR